MKKVLFVAAAAALFFTACKPVTDVLVSWGMVGDQSFEMIAYSDSIYRLYAQAAQEQGCLPGTNTVAIVRNQTSLNKAQNIALAIRDAVQEPINKMNIPYDNFNVALTVDGSDILGKETVCTTNYGLASRPDAQKGLTVRFHTTKDVLSFFTAELRYTLPSETTPQLMPLTPTKTVTVSDILLSYEETQCIVTLPATAKGEGKLNVVLTRNDKKADETQSYFRVMYGTFHIGYLGSVEIDDYIGVNSIGTTKGTYFNKFAEGEKYEVGLYDVSYTVK